MTPATQTNQRKDPRQQTFYAAFLHAQVGGEWLRSEVKVFDQSLGGVRIRSLRPVDADEVYLQLDPSNPCLARCTIRRRQAVARNCWEYGFELEELVEMQNVLPLHVIERYRAKNQRSARQEIAAATQPTPAQQIDQLLAETLGVTVPRQKTPEQPPVEEQPPAQEEPSAREEPRDQQEPSAATKPEGGFEESISDSVIRSQQQRRSEPVSVLPAEPQDLPAEPVKSEEPARAPIPEVAPQPVGVAPAVRSTVADEPIVAEPEAPNPTTAPPVVKAPMPTPPVTPAPIAPPVGPPAVTMSELLPVVPAIKPVEHTQSESLQAVAAPEVPIAEPDPSPPEAQAPPYLARPTTAPSQTMGILATLVAGATMLFGKLVAGLRTIIGSSVPPGSMFSNKSEEEHRLEWLRACSVAVEKPRVGDALHGDVTDAQ